MRNLVVKMRNLAVGLLMVALLAGGLIGGYTLAPKGTVPAQKFPTLAQLIEKRDALNAALPDVFKALEEAKKDKLKEVPELV
jgi:hypothetical protein